MNVFKRTKRIFCFFMILALFIAESYSSSIQKKGLDSETAEFLDSWNFTYEKMNVAPQHGGFPDNISVRFESKKEREGRIKNIIFGFPQEFLKSHKDLMHDFLLLLKETPLSYNTEVLFSANDENYIFDRTSFSQGGGTRFYASRIYDPSVYAAVCIYEKKDGIPLLIGGNRDTVTPQWLSYSIQTSFSKNGKELLIPWPFLYKSSLSLKDESIRVSEFLSKDIPAAGIFLDDNDGDILKTLIFTLDSSINDSREKNYIFLGGTKSGFFIGETGILVMFLIISMIITGSLCFTSFFRDSSREAILKDLKRTSFLFPAIFAVTGLFVLFSQFAGSLFIKGHPVFLLGTILSLTLFLSLIVFIVQIRHRFFVSFAAAGYQFLFLSALNIFIFSAVHLSLLLIFLAQYIIAFFLANRKSVKVLTGGLLILLILHALYFFKFLSFATVSSIDRFLKPSFLSTAGLTFATAPLLILVFRIVIALRIVDKAYETSPKRALLHYGSFCIVFTLIFSLTFFSTQKIFLTLQDESPANFLSSIPVENNECFTVKKETSDFYSLKSNKLTIFTDKEIVRYSIRISNTKDVPVYEANFGFSYINDSEVILSIPDYPPETLTVIYTGSNSSGETILIDAYFLEDGKIVHEHRQI